MSLQRIDALIQCFNGNSSIWNSLETVVPKGVLIFDTETKYLKLGNGSRDYASLPIWLDLNKAHDKYLNAEGLGDFVIPDATDVDKIVFINSDKKYAYGDITITELNDKFTGVDGINTINSAQDTAIDNLNNKFAYILNILANANNGKFVTALNNKFAPSDINVDTYIDSVTNEAASSVSLTIDDLKFYKDTELTEEASFLKISETYHVKIFANDRLENSITYDLSSASNCFDSITQIADELWTVVISSVLSSDITTVDLNVKCNTQYTLKNRIFNIDVVDPTQTLNYTDLNFYSDAACTEANKITDAKMNESSVYYAKVYCSDSYNLSRDYTLDVSDISGNLAVDIVTIENTQNERIFKITLGDVTSLSKYKFTATITNDGGGMKSADVTMSVLDISGAFTVSDIKFYPTLQDANDSTNLVTGNFKDHITYYAKVNANDDNGFPITYTLDWDYVDTGLPQDTADIQIDNPSQPGGNIFTIDIGIVNENCDIKFSTTCNNTHTTLPLDNTKTIQSSLESLSIDAFNTKFYDNPDCSGTPLNFLPSNSTAYIKIIASDLNSNAISGYAVTLESGETRIDPVTFPTNGQDNVGTIVLGTFDSNADNYNFTLHCETTYTSKDVAKQENIVSTTASTSIDNIAFYHDAPCTNEVEKDPNDNNQYKLVEDHDYYCKISVSDLYIDTTTFTYSLTPASNIDAFTIGAFTISDGYAIVPVTINDVLSANTDVTLNIAVNNGHNDISDTIIVELRDVQSGITAFEASIWDETISNLLYSNSQLGIFNDATKNDFALVTYYAESNNLPVTFDLTISNNTDNKISITDQENGNRQSDGAPYHYWILHINDLDADRNCTLTPSINNGYAQQSDIQNITVYDLYGNLSFNSTPIRIFDNNDIEVTGNLLDNKSGIYYAQIDATDIHNASITYGLTTNNDTAITNIQNQSNGKFTFNAANITSNADVIFTASINNGGGAHTTTLQKTIEDQGSIVSINGITFKNLDESAVSYNNSTPMLNENTSYYADVDATITSGHSVNDTDKHITCNDSNVVCGSASGDRFQITMPTNYTSNTALTFYVSYTDELGNIYNNNFPASGIDVDGGISIDNVLIYLSGDGTKTPIDYLLENNSYEIEVTATDINYPTGLQYSITLDGTPTNVTISTNTSNSSSRTLTIGELTGNESVTILSQCTNIYGGAANNSVTKTAIDSSDGFSINSVNIYSDAAYTNLITSVTDASRIRIKELDTYYLQVNVSDINSLSITQNAAPLNAPAILTITPDGTSDAGVVDKNRMQINSANLSNDADTSITFEYSNDGGTSFKTFTLNLTVVDLDQGLVIDAIKIHKSTETGNLVDDDTVRNLYDCWDQYVVEIDAHDDNNDLTGVITNYSITSNHTEAYTEGTPNGKFIPFTPNNISANIDPFTITGTITNEAGKQATFISHDYIFVDEDLAMQILGVSVYNTNPAGDKVEPALTEITVGSDTYYQLTDKRLNDSDAINKYIVEVGITETNGNNVDVHLNTASSDISIPTAIGTVHGTAVIYAAEIDCTELSADTNLLDIQAIATPQLDHTITKTDTFKVKVINTANATTINSITIYDSSDTDVTGNSLINGKSYYAKINVDDPNNFGVKTYSMSTAQTGITFTQRANPYEFDIDLSGVTSDITAAFTGTIVNNFGETNNKDLSSISILDVLHNISFTSSDYYDDEACTILSSDTEGTSNLLAGKTYYIKVHASTPNASIVACDIQLSGTVNVNIIIKTQINTTTFKLDLNSSITHQATLIVNATVNNGYYTSVSTNIITVRTIDRPENILIISGNAYYDDIDTSANPIDRNSHLLTDTNKLPATTSNNNHAYYTKIYATSGHNLSIDYQFFPDLTDPKVHITQVNEDGTAALATDKSSPWFMIQLDEDATTGTLPAVKTGLGVHCSNFLGVDKSLTAYISYYNALGNITIDDINFLLGGSAVDYFIENTNSYNGNIAFSLENHVDLYGLVINSYELTEDSTFINYTPTENFSNSWDFNVNELTGTEFSDDVNFVGILHTNYGDKTFNKPTMKIYNASEDLDITNINFYKTYDLNNNILSDPVTSSPPKLVEGEIYYAEVIADYHPTDLIISYNSITVDTGSLINNDSNDTITNKPDPIDSPNIFIFTITAPFTASSGYYDTCMFTAHCTVSK